MNKSDKHSNHIMLVDDEEIALKTLSSGLENQGYLVRAYNHPVEALEHFRQEVPDLVILDYNMPQLNGIELAREMLQHHHCPIIMLSAYNDLPVVREAIGVGITAYLVKPVEAQRLVPSIEAAIARFIEINALLKHETDLREGMENNRIISTAVGIVMVNSKLPQDLAFESLRRLARDQRRKLRDVAFDLLDNTSNAYSVLQQMYIPSARK
ncbi:ANTAR domain-containing response regulator [Kaarinaea lacus]